MAKRQSGNEHGASTAARPTSGAGRTLRPGQAAGWAACTAAVLAAALLTGCGNQDANAAPKDVSAAAAPVSGDKSGSKSDASPDGRADSPAPSGDSSAGRPSQSSSSNSGGGSTDSDGADKGGSASKGSGSGSGGESGACDSSELSASVGTNHPGAGQENFAVVLTNKSSSTCTVYGYPGFAFLDGAGKQVSVDPQRTGAVGGSVKLSPGNKAWAPLTFTNPEMTDDETVVPSTVRITPPDETTPLPIPWSGGAVSATGKGSTPKIGPLTAGSGE
ncbi:DUF4232 domain-containing protein [Streptomyces tsukubensis]|uniref:DUF4232 domain-containing protein n=1 Tax=Streptomyces tsukubensis TaxID=83656 RepID=A0A1V4A4E5_9ACTN|nr:DUF4232 domain-containing protein [Streptomyces tsukubensis]OON75584.1 hypothetical protein B1H18_22180 [Streptomyces tsukubensis]QFR94437.1 DUF4232 domain-containing protein [Streptomyces tsukubensis]